MLCSLRSTTLGAVLWLFAGSSFAVDTNVFTQLSDPAGFVTEVSYPFSATEVSTVFAPWETDGWHFTHWTIGSTAETGVRYEDALGKALNPVPFTINEDTVAVAHYLEANTDGDGDGVMDWFEVHYYNTTNLAAVSDTDGDGLTLLEEFRRDLHPGVVDAVQDGGLSRRRSDGVLLRLNPAFHRYTEKSIPAGFVSRSLVVSNGTVMVSPSLHGETLGYTFGYWTVDGVRQADLTGAALSSTRVTVTADVEVVAHYFKSIDDTNANGVPDWFEWYYTGSLSNAATDDTDGDGLDLLEEYRRDTHPGVKEGVLDGGVSRRRSELVLYDASAFVRYTINSSPLGFEDSAGFVTAGDVVETPSLHGERSGFTFAYWTVDGVRAADHRGVALSQVRIPIDADTLFTAHYLKSSEDLDGDKIPDWYEWYYVGGTHLGPEADLDGDGLSLLEEYRRDSDPSLYDAVQDGGVSRRRSSLTLMNMQFFERVSHVLVDGVITRMFTIWPPEVEGFAYGTNTCADLGDWDDDGDLDLFVTAGGASMTVYENIGTPHTVNLSDRSAVFAGAASGLQTPAVSCGDWSGDGVSDLLLGGSLGEIRLLRSQGSFDTAPAVLAPLTVQGSTSAVPALAELTGDDRLDLLVLLDSGSVALYANTGSPSTPFSAPSVTNDILGIPVPAAVDLSASDTNMDGLVDILVTDQEGRTWEFRQSLEGRFSLFSKQWAGTGFRFADRITTGPGDWEGDTDVDAVSGFAQGGLMYLRDPRLGPPQGLRAVGSARSVFLSWSPDPQSRVVGYYVYRGRSTDGPFTRITPTPLPIPEYRDEAPVAGVTNVYYVTALTLAYYPGSTVPRPVESMPSDLAFAESGAVSLQLRDYVGVPGSNTTLFVSIADAANLSGAGLRLEVYYDPAVAVPVSQVSTNPSVTRTDLSADLAFTDNSSLANGWIEIVGTGGTAIGSGHLFDLHFRVLDGVSPGTQVTNRFGAVALQNDLGQPLQVDSSDFGVLTVGGAYFLGDVNGDGQLNQADFQFFMWLLRPNTRGPTAQELIAGDFNGDGEMNHRDIPLFRQLLRDLNQGGE